MTVLTVLYYGIDFCFFFSLIPVIQVTRYVFVVAHER